MGWNKKLSVRFPVPQLYFSCSEVCITPAVKKKKRKFGAISAAAALLQNCKIPYVRLQVVFKALLTDWGWHLWRTCSCCVFFFVDVCAVPVYTLSMRSHCCDTLLCVCDQSSLTHTSCLILEHTPSVCSWILSLTQTAARLQSSVLHFVVAV